jgi:DNA-binding NtrC family response regulator
LADLNHEDYVAQMVTVPLSKSQEDSAAYRSWECEGGNSGKTQMNRGLILLLALDPMVEEAMTEALLETGGTICLARTADDAMRIVCSNASELELAVIDFDHGSNGMTLLSAIDTCANHHLPMLVLTPPGKGHARFVARANGAAECLAKPISTAQMAKAISSCRSKWELAQVA